MEDGRAPVWVTGNYDPETNIAYWGRATESDGGRCAAGTTFIRIDARARCRDGAMKGYYNIIRMIPGIGMRFLRH